MKLHCLSCGVTSTDLEVKIVEKAHPRRVSKVVFFAEAVCPCGKKLRGPVPHADQPQPPAVAEQPAAEAPAAAAEADSKPSSTTGVPTLEELCSGIVGC